MTMPLGDVHAVYTKLRQGVASKSEEKAELWQTRLLKGICFMCTTHKGAYSSLNKVITGISVFEQLFLVSSES